MQITAVFLLCIMQKSAKRRNRLPFARYALKALCWLRSMQDNLAERAYAVAFNSFQAVAIRHGIETPTLCKDARFTFTGSKAYKAGLTALDMRSLFKEATEDLNVSSRKYSFVPKEFMKTKRWRDLPLILRFCNPLRFVPCAMLPVTVMLMGTRPDCVPAALVDAIMVFIIPWTSCDLARGGCGGCQCLVIRQFGPVTTRKHAAAPSRYFKAQYNRYINALWCCNGNEEVQPPENR
jgi:hypothetical protein